VVVANVYRDAPRLLVEVKSDAPKLRPVIVTVELVDKGAFGTFADVMNGASKVSKAPCVPTTALTVIMMVGETRVLMDPLLHVTRVCADHPVVRHPELSSTNAVGVNVTAPKFRPTRLSVVEPVTAAFVNGQAEETTGAS